MRETAKLVTGVVARCPTGVIKCLPWLLLLATLYGGWVWAGPAIVAIEDSGDVVSVWQVAYGAAFMLWCIVNIFGTTLGCVLVHDRTFRNHPLPAWWGLMWCPGGEVRLWEPVVWLIFAPSVAFATLVEAVVRLGSVRIRRSR